MGVLNTAWEDMEFAISSFAPKDPLVPEIGRPYDRNRASDHYLMAIGLSPDQPRSFKKKSETNSSGAELVKFIPRNVRAIEVSSPLLDALCDVATSDMSAPDHQIFEKVIDALNASDEATVNSQRHGKKPRSKATLTAPGLLATLRERLLAAEPVLNFDFIRLTIDCGNLLSSFATQLGTLLGASDFDATCVQGLLLTSVTHPVWRAAAQILAAHISVHGDQYTKPALDRSSGRIPEHARPVLAVQEEVVQKVNEATGSLLDYLDVKFSRSGPTIAAYHPKFDPSATHTRDDQENSTTSKIGESKFPADQEKSTNGKIGESKFASRTTTLPFGDALPQVLADAKAKRPERAPEQFLHAQRKSLRVAAEKNAAGQITDADFCSLVRRVSGREVVKMMVPQVVNRRTSSNSPKKRIWVLCFEIGDKDFATYLENVLNILGDTEKTWKPILEKYWLPMPLAYWARAPHVDDETLDHLIYDIEHCVKALLEERMISEPAILEKMLEGFSQGSFETHVVEDDEEVDIITRERKRQGKAANAVVIDLESVKNSPLFSMLNLDGMKEDSAKKPSAKQPAANPTRRDSTATSTAAAPSQSAPARPFFGPPRPPHML